MMNNSVGLARLLASLAGVVESLDDAKLEAFLNGNFRLEIAGESIKPKMKSRSETVRPRTQILVDDFVGKLRKLASSEEGLQLLKGLDKAVLTAIAKKVHVRSDRTDDAESLTSKILRQTVGQRLSREAIRGPSVLAPTIVSSKQEDVQIDLPLSEEDDRQKNQP